MRSALIDIRHHHRRRWFSIAFPLSIPLSLSWLIFCLILSIYHNSNPKIYSNFKAYRQNFGKGGMASLVADIRRSTAEWLCKRENSENRVRDAEFFFFYSLWYAMGTFSSRVLLVPASDTGAWPILTYPYNIDYLGIFCLNVIIALMMYHCRINNLFIATI